MKRYYSYENFQYDTNKLLKQVKTFEPEAIVCIARGGLSLAHTISEGLKLRDVQTLRTELYDGSCKRENISCFGSCSFKDKKRVLVLDDIADSGETLKKIMNYLEDEFNDIEFKSATLFYKKSSIYEPHFWINEATQWIDFFWEKDFCID